MNFIRFFIDRPITTLMIYAILALIGIITVFQMPVDLMPGGDSGVLTIFVGVRGGLPPEDIERTITRPVEDEMASLPDLENISSVSRKERAVITLNLKAGSDSARAALEVQERLGKIQGKLPRDIEKPIVSRYNENQEPVIILAMSSKHFTPEQMRAVVDTQLKPVLKRVDGVANIEVGGGQERKILVEFDQTRLEAYALPIRQVIGQIGSQNLNALTGKVDKSRDSYFVRTVGAFKTIEDLGELPIATTKEGSKIRLKDVAQIRDFYMEAESHSRLNRQPVVSIYIQKEALANTITTAKRIKESADEFKKTLDKRIEFSVVSDQSLAVEKALKEVQKSLIEGAVLSSLILLIFLRDFLTASLILISIPLCIVITFAVMKICDLSLNVMTISGLAIATGMIVDDSIVVLEHITHKRNLLFERVNRMQQRAQAGLLDTQQKTPKEIEQEFRDIPHQATDEMFLAVLASTITTIIVFLPIVFLNNEVRLMYQGLAITVSSSLIVSLFVAITVIPSLSANVSLRWAKNSFFVSKYMWLFLESRFNTVRRWMDIVFAWAYRHLPQKIKDWRRNRDDDWVRPSNQIVPIFKTSLKLAMYRRAVAFLMRKRYWTLGILTVVLLGTLFWYRFLDKEFAGSTEQNEFTIFIELPSGTKLEVSNRVVSEVEKILSETPDIQQSVKNSVSRVEGWSSKIYVTLLPMAERSRSVEQVIAFLRPLLSKVGREYDAFVYFSEPSASKEFSVDIYGYDYNKLRDIAMAMAQVMGSIPGLTDIKLRYKPGRPEVKIELDRHQVSMMGFTVQEVAETIHAQLRGLRATYFMTPTAQVETVARLQEQYRRNLEDIEYLTMVNSKGHIVALRQFSKFEYGLTPSEVWRKNRERAIQVSANRGDVSLSKVAFYVNAMLRQVRFPVGYYSEIGGDFPKMVRTEKQSRYAFIVMVLLIYAVLASLFESYKQPALILIAIPFTLIGAVPMLYFTKTPVTLGTLIGMIMLGGISVKNSIMLVDVFNGLHKEKRELRALLEAGQLRMRPIVMTTLTAVLGMLPLIFGNKESNSLWKPMAVAVTGGLTVSTILVLFVFPAFHLIMNDAIAYFSWAMHHPKIFAQDSKKVFGYVWLFIKYYVFWPFYLCKKIINLTKSKHKSSAQKDADDQETDV